MSTMLSIEIRPENLIIAEGQATKGSVTIQKVITVPIPKGAVTESEISDEGPILEALEKIMKGHGVKSKSAVVTLDIGNMLLRDFEIPAGKNDELAGMVKTEMTQNYASASSDVVQFKKIGETTTEEGKKIRVRAMSLSSQIVGGYFELLKKLKLKPVAMDANSNAVEKLVHISSDINGYSIKDSTALILEFGIQGSVLHAIHDGEVQISRYTALGLSDLNEYISSKINQFGERGQYLNKLDFISDEQSEVRQHGEAFMVQWCSEIQKVVKFIMLRIDNSGISRIILTGEGTAIPGLNKIISENLNLPVETIHSINSVNFKREEDKNTLPLSINAIGALIRL